PEVVCLEEVCGVKRSSPGVLRVEHLEGRVQVSDTEDDDVAVIEEELCEVGDVSRGPSLDHSAQVTEVRTQVLAAAPITAAGDADAFSGSSELGDDRAVQFVGTGQQGVRDEREAEVALLPVDDVGSRSQRGTAGMLVVRLIQDERADPILAGRLEAP